MTFSDYLRVLRKFAGLIVTCAVLGGLIALAFAALPAKQYRAEFAVTLAPKTDDPGTYGNLIDSLDRRSVPSTFAEVVESPSVNDAAASSSRIDRAGLDVSAAIVGDSNVIETTVAGAHPNRVRDYAAALLDTSTSTFAKVYPLYSVTTLRAPTTSEAVPRPILTTSAIGAFAGAVFAYMCALVIDASRRRNSRARINPTPFAQARLGSDLGSTPRPGRRRPHRRVRT
jgi:capsular polysaccharide biosynthesis protein